MNSQNSEAESSLETPETSPISDGPSAPAEAVQPEAAANAAGESIASDGVAESVNVEAAGAVEAAPAATTAPEERAVFGVVSLDAVQADTPAVETPVVPAPVVPAPVAETSSGEVAAPETASVEAVSTEAASTDAVSTKADPVEAGPAAPAKQDAGAPLAPVAIEPEKSPLTLQFSPPPDTPFQSSLTLDILCASPGAEIRYALGADTVDETGLLFDSKTRIFLTESTAIAARAYKNGKTGPLVNVNFEIRKPKWLELEPADQSDATPHKAQELCVCEDGWHQAAASVRGKLHAHRGLWREDSYQMHNVAGPDGVWAITVVSDGAGSAPLSRVGSRLACSEVVKSLETSLGEFENLPGDPEALRAGTLPALRQALVGSAVAALTAIRAEAKTRDKPVSAFAATLLVLVRREWNDSQLFAALQIGDGSIALLDGNGLTLLGEADHGQHSSETRFLTTSGVENEFAQRVKFSIKNDLQAYAVMSDGVSDDYFPEEKRLSEVFDAVLPLIRPASEAELLLDWLGYEKKGSSDDRTLVVGWHAGPSLQTEATNGNEATDGNTG